ncbi:hypothetical protein LPJ53_006156 [Coemansia erecta]|uniref:Carbohydrate-binding domain-containing protein n=1 Tax=Coemansia erecta TaxID=147472 RepID=A0A9W7XV45_9FUNG|nr:hypothetical protein LPJ53_006156 [Coemansia erecta]
MTRLLSSLLVCLTASALAFSANSADLKIPACPSTTSFTYNTGIPAKDPTCPLTKVTICYTPTQLHLDFEAYNETNFYFDSKQKTNDGIWAYEVVEAFISKGSDDPQTYFEYEVNPNNVTYNAIVYNPSRVRATGTPFEHAYITDPFGDGFAVNTVLDKKKSVWKSTNVIPLGLFNGENPKGSTWRMNFFRTVTSPKKYPDQQLCGWKNTHEANFHITSAFGKVKFV